MLAILLAAAAAAADPAPAPAPPPPASAATTVSPVAVNPGPKANGEKLVCWTEAPSGTHQRTRVCATEAQLERSRRNAQEIVAEKKFNPSKTLGQ